MSLVNILFHFLFTLSLLTFSIVFDFVHLPTSFHQFKEQKLAANLKGFLEYERERFGLSTRILSGITTDNGPDVKAVSESEVLGPRFACLAHGFNLVIHHNPSVWNMPDAKK